MPEEGEVSVYSSSNEEGRSWPEGGKAVVSKISSKIKRRGRKDYRGFFLVLVDRTFSHIWTVTVFLGVFAMVQSSWVTSIFVSKVATFFHGDSRGHNVISDDRELWIFRLRLFAYFFCGSSFASVNQEPVLGGP
ncbi:hypothetical protein Q3G72_009096 [Acer saccharum]|nr:hypothetical protein Q3G72_009096 [Acer saccharum]